MSKPLIALVITRNRSNDFRFCFLHENRFSHFFEDFAGGDRCRKISGKLLSAILVSAKFLSDAFGKKNCQELHRNCLRVQHVAISLTSLHTHADRFLSAAWFNDFTVRWENVEGALRIDKAKQNGHQRRADMQYQIVFLVQSFSLLLQRHVNWYFAVQQHNRHRHICSEEHSPIWHWPWASLARLSNRESNH